MISPSLQKHNEAEVAPANTSLLEPRLGPWAFFAMFTNRDLLPGDELLYEYGCAYWNVAKENARRVKDKQKEVSGYI